MSPGAPEPRPILVWAIIASQFAPPFMFSGVTVALPTLGAELGATAISLGLVETLFLAGSLALMLPMGRLADASDKRTLYKLGLVGFSLCSILIALSNAMPWVLALRVLQGSMAAVFASTGAAIIAEIVPAERLGRAYGSTISAAYAGLTLGPMAAGWLVDAWGWRAVFVAGALLLAAAAAVVQATMPSTWRWPGRVIHIPSALGWTLAVSLAVTASATLRRGLPGYLALGAALAVGALFVQVQRRIERPLLDVRYLAKNRPLASALFVQLLLYMAAFASIFMLSIYMQVTLGQTAARAGQVIAAGTVSMALVAPLSGVLSDRYRPRVVSSVGVALVFVTSLLAAALDAESSLLHVALVITVQGLGFALFSTPNMKVIMSVVDRGTTGLASALGATSRSLGMVSGMLVTGLMIGLHIGPQPIEADPAAFLDTMRGTYRVFTWVTGIALVVSIAVRGARSHAEPPTDPQRGTPTPTDPM